MKKTLLRTISILCALTLILPLAVFTPLPARAVTIPTPASAWARVSTIFDEALDFDQARSGGKRMTNFTGLCSHYVHLQLMILGVNTSYIGVNGKDAYDRYKNLSYSTGGMKIHAYPATSKSISGALRAIASVCGTATNIMLGFQSTMTASGKKYGHAMLIHALIDGYVYYTDNFAERIGNTYYEQGDPIKCTISEFEAFYGRPTVFTYEGMIWFENEQLTAAVNSGQPGSNPGVDDPDEPGGQTPQADPYTPGVYEVDYSGGLRIRAESNTSCATLDIIPNGYTVYATEIENGFGRVFCNYQGKRSYGWVYLGLTRKISALPSVCADTYDKSGNIVSREWFDTLESAAADSAQTATLVLFSDGAVSSTIEIGPGRELRLGGYKLTSTNGGKLMIRGGKATSNEASSFIERDPFVRKTAIPGGFSYKCPYTITLKGTSVVMDNNPEIIFRAETDFSGGTVDYLLECAGFNGGDGSFAGSASGGSVYYRTSGIPVKLLAGSFTARAVIRAKSDPDYYISSDDVSYCPAENLGGYYSKDQGFDRLIVSLLNYATAAQTLFDPQSAISSPANRYLPQSARISAFLPEQAVKALDAPSVAATGSVGFSSYALDFSTGGRLSIMIKADSSTADTRMLVFSYSDLERLKAEHPGVPESLLLTEDYCTTVLSHDGDGRFRFSGFTAKQYADTFYFRIVKGTGSGRIYSAVDSYSVTKYCERMINDGITDGTDDLCRAICEYSAAAREYFGYTVNGN